MPFRPSDYVGDNFNKALQQEIKPRSETIVTLYGEAPLPKQVCLWQDTQTTRALPL